MPQSRGARSKALSRYDALVKDATYTSYGYWRVTFSVAPSLDLWVMLCDPYLDAAGAIDQARVTLGSVTGQKVTERQ